MNRLIKYCFIFFGILQGCEQIYTPRVDEVESAIVVDARIVSGTTENVVSLYQSLGYNDESTVYPSATGASVWIISNTGTEIELEEAASGKYPVNIVFDSDVQYKLKIIYEGETYESTFESVPPVPSLDTVYGEAGIKVVAPEGSNNADDLIETEGVQLYTDILNNNQSPYFRFTARIITQYHYSILVATFGGETETYMFAWYSSTPADAYNIASPGEYSSSDDIIKHPLYFMAKEPGLTKEDDMVSGPYFDGFILILTQYGLSESAYNFYDDLNKQLEASGKLFDPMYVQARNNLSCTSNSDKVVLGNFEISSVSESRYYVRYMSQKAGYLVKPVPYFYDIPQSGEQLETPPDFWEQPEKQYPDK